MPGVVAGNYSGLIPVMGTSLFRIFLVDARLSWSATLSSASFWMRGDPTFGSAAALILMVMTLVVTYFYTRKFGFGEEIVVA